MLNFSSSGSSKIPERNKSEKYKRKSSMQNISPTAKKKKLNKKKSPLSRINDSNNQSESVILIDDSELDLEHITDHDSDDVILIDCDESCEKEQCSYLDDEIDQNISLPISENLNQIDLTIEINDTIIHDKNHTDQKVNVPISENVHKMDLTVEIDDNSNIDTDNEKDEKLRILVLENLPEPASVLKKNDTLTEDDSKTEQNFILSLLENFQQIESAVEDNAMVDADNEANEKVNISLLENSQQINSSVKIDGTVKDVNNKNDQNFNLPLSENLHQLKLTIEADTVANADSAVGEKVNIPLLESFQKLDSALEMDIPDKDSNNKNDQNSISPISENLHQTDSIIEINDSIADADIRTDQNFSLPELESLDQMDSIIEINDLPKITHNKSSQNSSFPEFDNSNQKDLTVEISDTVIDADDENLGECIASQTVNEDCFVVWSSLPKPSSSTEVPSQKTKTVLETLKKPLYDNSDILFFNTAPDNSNFKLLSNKNNKGELIYQGSEQTVNTDQEPKMKKTRLREIVIDGNNVGMAYTNGKSFSETGIALLIKYFTERKHSVKVFIPQYRRCSKFPLLEKWYTDGIVVFTPSRKLGTKHFTPYDDRYILEYAVACDGIIVSQDQFRDLYNENEKYKSTIENRLLVPTFVGDFVMFPADPLGRDGPSLATFLRH